MPTPELAFVTGLIFLLGFFLEGLGIYNALMFSIIPLAVFLGVKLMVAILSIIDLMVSYIHYKRLPVRKDLTPVKPQINAIIIGTLFGVMLLKIIPDEILGIVLGIIILVSSYDIYSGGRIINKIIDLQSFRTKALNSKPEGLRITIIFTILLMILSAYNCIKDPSIIEKYALGKIDAGQGHECLDNDEACLNAEIIRIETIQKTQSDLQVRVFNLIPIVLNLLLIPVYIIIAIGLLGLNEKIRIFTVGLYSFIAFILLLIMMISGLDIMSFIQVVVVLSIVFYLLQERTILLFNDDSNNNENIGSGTLSATDKNICMLSGLLGGLFVYNRPLLMLHLN